MPPLTVREDLDGLRDLAPSLLAGLVATVLHQLILQRSPETLHRRVVIAIPLPTHGWDHAELAQRCLIYRGTIMAAANRYLVEPFLPAYNQRFAGTAAETGTAFVPWIGSNLADMLCVQEDRVVANDTTVRYQGRHLQIPLDAHRYHDVTGTVRVQDYPEGTVAVFHGPRCLARYQSDGRVIEPGGTPSGRRSPTRGSADRSIVDSRAIVREKISARG